jgi:hypothetical protein
VGWAHNGESLVLDIAPDAEPDGLAIVVEFTADNGGPWRVTVALPISYPPVLFQLRNHWLYDPAPGGNKDGAANPGERLQPRVRLRNAGVEAAVNVRVPLQVEGAGVAVLAGALGHSVWPAREARNNDGFLPEVAPDAAPTFRLARVRVEADNGGPWVFDIPITIVDLPPEFSFRSSWTFDPGGNHDGAANPGERIRPRIRLRNDGPGVGRNVRISVSASDPSVTVVAGLVHHAVWPSGEARNSDGLLIDIAPRAVAGVVEVTVRVSVDAAGPWTFVIEIPIVVPAVEFALRSAWVFDPAPGGNKNGIADAGESVFPRVRLRNEGSGNAADVRVVLSSPDPDIAIVAGTVSHASWAASSAGNNEGFFVAVAPGALSHEVRLTVHVAARSGGPWEFEIALPVAAAPVMARRSFWVRDKETGDDDGHPNPGETVDIRARLRNTGAEPARDVVVTLVAEDPTVTVTGSAVAHVTWAAGDARNNAGLAIKVAASASGDVALTVIVTAAHGGPWRFTYTVPIVRNPCFVFRQAWVRDRTTGDGDGVAEPGERVEVRARIKNEGSIAAEAVTVILRSSDAGAGVAEGVVAHATWPAGEGRNNVGLVVDLADGVGPSVEFVLDVTAGNGGPWQFRFSLTTTGDGAPASPAHATLVGPAGASRGDINGDAVVDILDILALARVCGAGAAAFPPGDMIGDGRLSVTDLALAHTRRTDIPSWSARPGVPRRTLVDEWLRDARRLADASASYAEGVAALERIRATLTPNASDSLANYPNPFNPETWIPFDLARPASVMVTIYGIHGRRARQLYLGWRVQAATGRGARRATGMPPTTPGTPSRAGCTYVNCERGAAVKRVGWWFDGRRRPLCEARPECWNRSRPRCARVRGQRWRARMLA